MPPVGRSKYQERLGWCRKMPKGNESLDGKKMKASDLDIAIPNLPSGYMSIVLILPPVCTAID